MRTPDESRPSSVGCALADAVDLVGGNAPTYASGVHWDRSAALAAALGEALERYSAVFVCERDLLSGTAAELGPEAVDPRRFVFFHDRQHEVDGFPFGRADRTTRLRWTGGFAVPGGARAYLPAQLVYMGLRPGDEPALAATTSNGLACAPTLEEAVLGGLFEIVERDCFMIAWYNRLSLPHLDWADDPRLADLDARFFRPTGLEYSVVDLSAFFDVPAALAVVRSAGRGAPLGVGAGAAATIAEAWRKATTEAFGVHRWIRDKLVDEPARRPSEPAEIATFDDHVLYYADPCRTERAAFLDASQTVRATRDVCPLEGGDVRAQIDALARRLAARGASAYAVDVTAPDVRAAELRVARVISPELCTLDVLGWAPHFGGRRMSHAAFELGLVPRPLALQDFNRDPHPFP